MQYTSIAMIVFLWCAAISLWLTRGTATAMSQVYLFVWGASLKRSCEGTCVLWQPHDISKEYGNEWKKIHLLIRYYPSKHLRNENEINRRLSVVADAFLNADLVLRLITAINQVKPLPLNCNLLLNWYIINRRMQFRSKKMISTFYKGSITQFYFLSIFGNI